MKAILQRKKDVTWAELSVPEKIRALCLLILLIVGSLGIKQSGYGISTGAVKVLLIWVIRVFAALFMACNIKNLRTSKENIKAIIFFVLSWFISFIWQYTKVNPDFTNLLICVLLLMQSDRIRVIVFKYYKVFLVCAAFIGVICYSSYLLHLGIPYVTKPYNYRDGWKVYFDYKLAYLFYDRFTVRLCGLFSEPGVFGTYIAFCLIADDLNFKKKENIVLAIAGLCTLSIAFILIIVVYFVLRNIKNYKLAIPLMILLIFWIFILPNIHTGITNIDHVLGRLVITKDGLAGNDRTSSYAELLFNESVNSVYVLFGHGNGYCEYMINRAGASMASIKTYIINYGIIGTLVMFVPIFMVLLNKYKNNYLIVCYLICTAISLYQRPFLLTNFTDFTMLICGISFISFNNKKMLDRVFNERNYAFKNENPLFNCIYR